MKNTKRPYVLKYNLTPHCEGDKEEDGRECSLYLELGTTNQDDYKQCLSFFGWGGIVEIDMTDEGEIEDFFNTVDAMRTIYNARKAQRSSE